MIRRQAPCSQAKDDGDAFQLAASAISEVKCGKDHRMKGMDSMKRSAASTYIAIMLLAAGCKAPWKDPPSTIEQPGTAAQMNLPPQQMVQLVKQVVTSPSL